MSGNQAEKWFKITLDVISAFSVILMFIIGPILVHYGAEADALTQKLNTPRNIPPYLKLLMINALPSGLAFIWLNIRYANIIPFHKYWNSPQDRVSFIIIGVISFFLIRLILQYTLFRWISLAQVETFITLSS